MERFQTFLLTIHVQLVCFVPREHKLLVYVILVFVRMKMILDLELRLLTALCVLPVLDVLIRGYLVLWYNPELITSVNHLTFARRDQYLKDLQTDFVGLKTLHSALQPQSGITALLMVLLNHKVARKTPTQTHQARVLPVLRVYTALDRLLVLPPAVKVTTARMESIQFHAPLEPTVIILKQI